MAVVRAPRTLKIAALVTLASQIIIVGTGGAVRLTGSGLGCSSWPHCTPESFTPVAEHGIHGFIEYGNRVFGAVVTIIALVMLILAIRHVKRGGDRALRTLAIVILAGTVAQALIGAVVVWMHLRPDTVGIHFVLSVILVALATVLAWRAYDGPAGEQLGTRLQRILTHAMTGVFAIVIFVGILVTGSGPHAGDGGALRNGLDSELLQHIHSWPAYLLFALTVTLFFVALRNGPRRTVLWLGVLLGIEFAQIFVGLVQSNTGLPIGLVGIHLVLSVCATAAVTTVVLSLRASALADSPTESEPVAA